MAYSKLYKKISKFIEAEKEIVYSANIMNMNIKLIESLCSIQTTKKYEEEIT